MTGINITRPLKAAGNNGEIQFNGGGIQIANPNLFWDDTNNRLGIGTASPGTQFEISSNAGGELSLVDADYSVNQKVWNMNSVAGKFTIRRMTDAYSGYNPALTIDGSDNVGIGTVSPGAKLHLFISAGDAADLNLKLENDATANKITRILLENDNNENASFGIMATGGTTWPVSSTVIDYNTAGPLVFTEATVEFMRLDNSGNLGIGTVSPNSTLHVNGGITFKRIVTVADYIATGSDYIVGVGSRTAPITVTLPPIATTGSAQAYVVKDEGGVTATGSIVIKGSGAELIDGFNTFTLSTGYESKSLYSNGASWSIF